ncbi:hypothetical protein ACJMK2_000353 [Sinanodonta woodiana]|uniref:Uncharacterized protein n=1 Tax=Sinanodonta woodiana TaxID=1069815 RepID=A0ABD3XSK3_SINWO
MASSREDTNSEETQNCSICLCDFKIPRQLPCMHTFCEKCLQDYISSREETVKILNKIECPICRQAVSPEGKGKSSTILASMCPINVIFQSILNDDAIVKVDRSCDSCHSAGKLRSAQDFCVECDEGMCETCSDVHRNQKMSRNHVILSMDELTSNPENVMKIAKGFGCPEHEGEAKIFYCRDHKIACCSKCCIVSHRNCASVSDLNTELPSLLNEFNPDSVIDKMKKLETHLKSVTKVNESSTSLLASQVNDLTNQIRELRTKINGVLDELEQKVKMEGHKICKEELIRKQEENHHCQSLINSIRNSHSLLETVKKYGTETQVFLMTEKIKSQLVSYLDQIQERYMKTETTTALLEINPQVQLFLSISPDSVAKITSKRELQRIPSKVIKKTFRNFRIQMERTIELTVKDRLHPAYRGITYLYSGHLLLADESNKILHLLDSTYNPITSYGAKHYIFDVCVLDDNDDVAVTMPLENRVQFLSVSNGKITPTRTITTRYTCHGIAAAGKGNIIISGYRTVDRKPYWSHVTSEGKEICHLIESDCKDSYTYVAVDSSFTRVYITVNMAHSLYCFDMSGKQKFCYRPDSLKNPRSVATDKYDNVYVAGYGSNNIHQLTPDGDAIQIISNGVPSKPLAICFNRDGDVFLVTNVSDARKKLYKYKLK